MTFVDELSDLIAKHGRNLPSNTDPAILATYLETCLVAFENATKGREGERGESDIPDDVETGSSERS